MASPLVEPTASVRVGQLDGTGLLPVATAGVVKTQPRLVDAPAPLL